MPVYTVHVPVAALSARTMDKTTDRYVFVRDGFYLWAMLAPVVWMLWHRLWLALIGYIVIVAAVMFGLSKLGVDPGTGFIALALISILIGLEAATLRRRKLSRGKWRQLDVVVADDEETAERRFFDRHAASFNPQPSWIERGPQQPSSAPYAGARDVIGSFPQPGAPR